jgi:pimeloyl-ACP methyl ester carboxylesterase
MDPSQSSQEVHPVEISPFTLDVPEAEVRDLKSRLAHTRWPTDVASDWSRGTPVSYARTLVDRWANEFDWVGQQERLNAFPQFVATIDGQPIHFVHVRSAIPDATPLLLAHGYPSSFVEFTRMIGPLVDPEAHGGRPEDAFHLVIPSLPGFGFSTPTTSAGWGIQRTANAFDAIMQALGYERYGVAGGDIGAGIAEELCLLAGERIIGSLVVSDPGAIATEYTPPTDHLTPQEQERLQSLKAARAEDFGYLAIQTTRPQSIAYGLTDSPVMQLTWIVEKIREWTDPSRDLPEDAVDPDDLLTLASVYWFGKGGAGAANFLYEAMHSEASWGRTHDRPQGFVSFGVEPLVRRVLDPNHERAYWNEHAEGGHFPAMEQPDLFVGDLRAFFATLR